MCLTIEKNIEPQIATKDIVVYKFLESIRGDADGKYQTPFRCVEVEIGVTYQSKLHVIEAGFNNSISSWKQKVDFGLHTFGNYADCYKYANKYATRMNATHVVKAIIPKGSRYYVGRFDDVGHCYASDTARYVEILKSF